MSARLNTQIKVLFWKKIELYPRDGIFVHVKSLNHYKSPEIDRKRLRFIRGPNFENMR
ncbi:MAG: hypothetical protein ACTSPD_21310 [Promethearchaeota archaeon]